MLTCTDADLEALLDPDAVIAAIRQAFGPDYQRIRMPQRIQLDVGSAIALIMPCAISDENICGLKIVRVSHDPRSKERLAATYLMIDIDSGRTVAVLAANYLTDVRTAATSAIATDLLARRNAATLGIFGTGRQANAHVRMFCRDGRFRQLFVSGHSRDKTQAFVARLRAQYRIEITSASAETCASVSDVICTCTSSTQPLFPGELIRPGTHINLIGTFQPHAREADSVLIRRSRMFVDTYRGALSEAGDILVPMHAGEIEPDHIQGDLHELMTSAKPGRISDSDITVFKSVGCALEDLVTARLAMQTIQNRAAPRP